MPQTPLRDTGDTKNWRPSRASPYITADAGHGARYRVGVGLL